MREVATSGDINKYQYIYTKSAISCDECKGNEGIKRAEPQHAIKEEKGCVKCNNRN